MRCIQVSVAAVAERVAEVEIVEVQLDPLRVRATEAEVARDVSRIRVRIERRVKRSGDRLIAAVFHPARRVCTFKVVQGQGQDTLIRRTLEMRRVQTVYCKAIHVRRFVAQVLEILCTKLESPRKSAYPLHVMCHCQ